MALDPAATITKQTDLRLSIDQATKEAIRQATAEIPEGKTAALIVIADQHGSRVQFAKKIGENWKVANEVGKPWHGKIEGRVALVGSW